MVYDDLIKMMRHCSNTDAVCGVTDVCPFYDKAEEDSGYYFCVERMMREAADAIEKLWELFRSAEKDNAKLTAWYVEKCNKHKWIPVTERLPELNTVVQITDGIDVGHGYLASITSTQNMVYPSWHSPFCDVDETHITHWMPLPEPPKEKES